MEVVRTVTRIPGQSQIFKYVLRQNPPAPVNFTATASTQSFVILGLPANHVVTSVRLELVTTFSAFGLSSCLVSVGANDGVAPSSNWYAPSFETVQAVSRSSFQYWSPFSTFTLSAHDITANFTATGAQLAALTAGELEITVGYRSL
jgi:hypothetical protein